MSVKKTFDDDLAKLSDDTLLWLLDQIYEPADKGLEAAIKRVLWGRNAQPIFEWPAYDSSFSAPPWAKTLGHDHLVYYCPKGAGHREPEHRAVRALFIGDRRRPDIECSCGLRIDLWKAPREQRVGRAQVWPTMTLNGIPHFVVCSQAKAADDPKHAPTGAEYDPRCICGWTLDPERCRENGSPLKILPAY